MRSSLRASEIILGQPSAAENTIKPSETLLIATLTQITLVIAELGFQFSSSGSLRPTVVWLLVRSAIDVNDVDGTYKKDFLRMHSQL